MLGILTIQHSNAGCERIFSQVPKNKTDFRGSLSSKTLSSILVAKSHMKGHCYSNTFTTSFLKNAKSATYLSLKGQVEQQE